MITKKANIKFSVYPFGKVICVSSDYIVSYFKGYIYLFDRKMNKIISKKQIDNGVSKFTLLSRILRKEPRCAALTDKNTCIISYSGKILRYNLAEDSIIDEHYYMSGMKNPLSFCVVKNIGKQDNTIYYGEYFSNNTKSPVSIYKRENNKWEKIYEFNTNTIKHIHNIIYDNYRNIFYVLTGDSDNGSGIWIADINFKKITPLYVGKQEYRTCMVIPTQEGLLYATDNPLGDNFIIKIFLNNFSISSVKKLCRIPGPCIYFSKIGNKYLFSTSVEPNSSLPIWRYLLTNKIGKGVSDKKAHVFILNENESIKELLQDKKDFLPMGLFQFGTYQFPYNTTKEIVVTTQALSTGHAKTFFFKEEHIKDKNNTMNMQ